MERAVMEFSELLAVQPTGFQLAGSGSADVVTAPWYRPNVVYDVTLSSSTATTLEVAADSWGRLAFNVPLGPSNSAQQSTAAAQLVGTQVYVTTVTIAAPDVR